MKEINVTILVDITVFGIFPGDHEGGKERSKKGSVFNNKRQWSFLYKAYRNHCCSKVC